MRYRRNKTNWPLIAGALIAIVAAVGGLGLAAYQSFGKPVPDKFGCYDSVEGKQIFALIDVSAPGFDADQRRAVRRYFQQAYARLGFGDRISVFTTEGDQQASVLAPRFHICGPATKAEQLTAIRAKAGPPGYLQKNRARLFVKRFLPELEAVFSARSDDERRARQSPILEMVADLSRRPDVKAGAKITLISDLVQNSPESAQFCHVRMDMPPLSLFAQLAVYQERLRPEPLNGIAVDVLQLVRPGYGPYCPGGEDEIRRFWIDYFHANGVKNPRVIRIRYGQGG